MWKLSKFKWKQIETFWKVPKAEVNTTRKSDALELSPCHYPRVLVEYFNEWKIILLVKYIQLVYESGVMTGDIH